MAGVPGKLVHDWTLDRLAGASEPELVIGVAQALRGHLGVAGKGVLGYEYPRLQVDAGWTLIKKLAWVIDERNERAVDEPPAS